MPDASYAFFYDGSEEAKAFAEKWMISQIYTERGFFLRDNPLRMEPYSWLCLSIGGFFVASGCPIAAHVMTGKEAV